MYLVTVVMGQWPYFQKFAASQLQGIQNFALIPGKHKEGSTESGKISQNLLPVYTIMKNMDIGQERFFMTGKFQ